MQLKRRLVRLWNRLTGSDYRALTEVANALGKRVLVLEMCLKSSQNRVVELESYSAAAARKIDILGARDHSPLPPEEGQLVSKTAVLEILLTTLQNADLSADACDSRYIERIEAL